MQKLKNEKQIKTKRIILLKQIKKTTGPERKKRRQVPLTRMILSCNNVSPYNLTSTRCLQNDKTM